MIGFRTILITGGAGFVGSSLALSLRRDFPDVHVVALDNLKRRGSELNVARFQRAGIDFVHGDVREIDDLNAAGQFDLLIDCAAEPSVLAGLHGSPKPLFDANLSGTINALEVARKNDAAFLFLSTSRVYPIASLNCIPYVETATRYRWTDTATITGVSSKGVSEDFPLNGPRSYYGASKLAGELIAQEYAATAHIRVLINRCGIVTGPWQMGKVDQGVVALWVLKHHFKQPLKYIGYGGGGRQVRDLLDVNDLYGLVMQQMRRDELWDGRVYNVGGGTKSSVSLCELTGLCREVTGNTVPISPVPETSPVDLRIYVTDSSRVQAAFDWKPECSPQQIVAKVHHWICEHESQLEALIASN